MPNLEPPWDQYLKLQTKLHDATTVDELSWGREAQLNRILASDTVLPNDEIERVARSERRRERYRARLRRQHLSPDENRVDGEAVVQAIQQLRLIRGALTDEEWTLLSNVGEGSSYGEISTEMGRSEGALRVRARRARQKIEALAA